MRWRLFADMCCMCAVCVGAQRHMCAGAGVPGSWYWVMGWGLGPAVGRRAQVGAPRGFSALMASMPHLFPHSRLDAARCPVGVSPARSHLTGSIGGVGPLAPTLRGSRTRARSIPNGPSGESDPLSPPDPADAPSWARGAAPPAGSLGRCSRATSGPSLRDPGP